jgi:hypothetical protein
MDVVVDSAVEVATGGVVIESPDKVVTLTRVLTPMQSMIDR